MARELNTAEPPLIEGGQVDAFEIVKLPTLPGLLLAGAAFVAGFAASHWLSRPYKGTDPASEDPNRVAGELENHPLSPSELRQAIRDQEKVVMENRRRLEEVLPDVSGAEERLERSTEIVARMSRADLPEKELMELATVLGGAPWMPEAVADYRKSQEIYRALSDRYGSKHPKMISADEHVTGLADKITAETGRVFGEQQKLRADLEAALPGLREKAAQAQETPEKWQPLEKALRASETRLMDLRMQLAGTMIRQRG